MGSQGEVKSFTEVAGGAWHFYEAVPKLRKRKPVLLFFSTSAPGALGDQLVIFQDADKNSEFIRYGTIQ